jgi:hypothetical protein
MVAKIEEPKLSAPVGREQRAPGSKGPPVRNKSEDISLLRQMLRFNGYYVGDKASMDDKLIKVIEAVQKRAGVSKPDGVVDPGGKTFSALLDKHMKALAKIAEAGAKEEERQEKFWQVTVNGKLEYVTQKQMARLENEYLQRMAELVDVMDRSRIWKDKQVKEIKDAEDVTKDFLVATRTLFVRGITGAPPFDTRPQLHANSAVKAARMMINARRFDKIELAIRKMDEAMGAYHDGLIAHFNHGKLRLKVVGYTSLAMSAVGFAAAAVIATKILVVAGASVGLASMGAGAFTGVVESSSKEVGKALSGTGNDWDLAFKNVLVDGSVGTLLGRLSAIAPIKSGSAFTAGLPKILTSRFPYLSSASAVKIVDAWVGSLGTDTLKSIASAAGKALGEFSKTGKAPTEKDVVKIMTEIVIGAVSPAMTKSLERFSKQWTDKAGEALSEDILPKLLTEKLKPLQKTQLPGATGKLAKLLDLKASGSVRNEIAVEVAGKLQEEAFKTGVTVGMEETGTNDDLGKSLKAARDAVARDATLRRKADAELTRALKTRGVKL